MSISCSIADPSTRADHSRQYQTRPPPARGDAYPDEEAELSNLEELRAVWPASLAPDRQTSDEGAPVSVDTATSRGWPSTQGRARQPVRTERSLVADESHRVVATLVNARTGPPPWHPDAAARGTTPVGGDITESGSDRPMAAACSRDVAERRDVGLKEARHHTASIAKRRMPSLGSGMTHASTPIGRRRDARADRYLTAGTVTSHGHGARQRTRVSTHVPATPGRSPVLTPRITLLDGGVVSDAVGLRHPRSRGLHVDVQTGNLIEQTAGWCSRNPALSMVSPSPAVAIRCPIRVRLSATADLAAMDDGHFLLTADA